MMLEHLVDQIPWQSETQKKGFLAMSQWLKLCHPQGADLDWRLAYVAAFFIQKDHESHEWWASVVGDQVKRLQQDIATVTAETDAKLGQLRTNYALEIAALREELERIKGRQ